MHPQPNYATTKSNFLVINSGCKIKHYEEIIIDEHSWDEWEYCTTTRRNFINMAMSIRVDSEHWVLYCSSLTNRPTKVCRVSDRGLTRGTGSHQVTWIPTSCRLKMHSHQLWLHVNWGSFRVWAVLAGVMLYSGHSIQPPDVVHNSQIFMFIDAFSSWSINTFSVELTLT